MTNTQRNTTVLSVLLAVILGSGYLLVNRIRVQVNDLKGKITTMQTEMKKLDKIMEMQPKLEKDYADQQLMLANQSKVIAQQDNPSLTYNYLLNIMQWMGRNLDFDFSLSANNLAGSQWNEYIVSGKSPFLDVTDFVKQLEYQRVLLTIEDLAIATDPSEVSDSVRYSVILRTHFALSGSDISNVTKKDVPAPQATYSSFYPRVYNNPPVSDINPDLIRVDKAVLIGITASRVFLRGDNGVIRILSMGDQVAYGYLYAIDREKERAIFRINQYGTAEDVSLFLEKQP